MIIVTGAAGFIGSNIVNDLFRAGYREVVAVDLDDLVTESLYLNDKSLVNVPFDDLANFIDANHQRIQAIIHMGACSDTTETDPKVFETYNLSNSKMLWSKAADYGLVFIYASSAATYGDGALGYSDTLEHIYQLRPLNMYGQSKQDFDLWALAQSKKPLFWAGLKFFNVYGPNEDHKGRMASVVRHAYYQISRTGSMRLFRSHHSDFKDGEQIRDFVYVKDVVKVVLFLMEQRSKSGIYNVGYGKGRTFNALVEATFQAMGLDCNIEYIDTPLDIRDKYQYYTCATVDALKNLGYGEEMTSLEAGVRDYVCNYLAQEKHN